MKKLWGGVFQEDSDALADQFGQSFDSDLNFWQEDVTGSIAHARMLGKTGIIPEEDAARLIKGLQQILDEGPERLSPDAEDIHAAVESRLFEICPEAAGKLHTARSRNDQVATDTRLYLRRAIQELSIAVRELQKTLLDQAKTWQSSIMPGWTHAQRAQPMTLGFWMLAHFWSFQRHGWRLARVAETAGLCPLGSGPLAGTSFPIDRFMTSAELGFAAPAPNALDAVSDRGCILDALHTLALIMIDLSRLSQEMILFTSTEFGFAAMGDSVTTGSSIMPQKRNPDMAELIRGRTGRAIANWTALATTMKGLTLGYNRDTQEDKPPLFESVSLTFDSLRIASRMLQKTTWNTDRMAASMRGDFSTATDLANFLAASGMPFREAHETVGRVVRACIEKGIGLEDLTAESLASIAPKVPAEALDVLTPEASVRARESYGGPGPKAMAQQIRLADRAFESETFELCPPAEQP